MAKKPQSTITIIGAGLAGCFMAILLAKRGYNVRLIERTDKKEIMDTASRRSFNITFYGYAVKVLKEAGLWDRVEPTTLTLRGSMTQITQDSEPIFALLDNGKMPYYSVQRALLLKALLKVALHHPRITAQFSTTLLSIDRNNQSITIRNEKTQKTASLVCDVLLGADGVNSLVRTFLQRGQEASHSQEYAAWSYKQILFSKTWVKKLALRNDVAYTWSRKEAVIASFPNRDGSRAAILTLPKGKKGFQSLTSPAAIKRFISEQFPALLPALPVVTEAIMQNPEGNFVTIHTSPWYYKGFAAILGDAAHGFYPFFGQGASAAFGDAEALATLLDKYGPDWKKIFPLYQKTRKVHMDTLGELSKEGFIRYRRYKKADYGIIYDHFDMLLHRLFPKFFQPPLYEQITIDPGHTADYLLKQAKQRRITRLLGSSILIHALTSAIALQERGIAIAKRRKE